MNKGMRAKIGECVFYVGNRENCMECDHEELAQKSIDRNTHRKVNRERNLFWDLFGGKSQFYESVPVPPSVRPSIGWLVN